YLTYRDRSPEIRYSPSSESASSLVSRGLLDPTAAALSPAQPDFQPELSWTHSRVLMRVSSPEARPFYAIQCAQAGRPVAPLERSCGPTASGSGRRCCRAFGPTCRC